MKNMNQIGIEKKKAKELSEKMNALLSTYQVFYMNVRGYHWNIRGQKFFELHVKFEELYTNLLLKIDELAERILTLGYTPIHSYADYLKNTAVKEHTNAKTAQQTVPAVVESLNVLIKAQREILDIAEEDNDKGTADIMSDYIREQEKTVWMYNAWLND